MSRPFLAAAAWPYANGPRHIGHVVGFGIPTDIWSRWARMAGHDVLMVSGTDEHGTPVTVEADQAGVSPRTLADRNNALIVDDLERLGLSYDLFTRTTTRNHYQVVQEIFRGLLESGGIIEVEQMVAFAESDGRSLPDRYIEGTCPICGAAGARGDQCDTCGNQLDPIDLIDPLSKVDGLPPVFRPTKQYALDLPHFAGELRSWIESQTSWRPNVRDFTLTMLDDARERAITRDIGWGVPIPLPEWQDDPLKRIYVWFDAVIGYLSASIEWAQHQGDPDAWKRWWLTTDSRHAYFMGKDNIVFHAFLWPAILSGYDGELRDLPATTTDKSDSDSDSAHPPFHLPDDIVASEFLTMEGRKFSSSRRVVIYVKDVVDRYGPDALRFALAAGGPETSDTDFTWSELVRRNNDELVATWGNLVQRVCSMLRRNGGTVPTRDNRPDDAEKLLDEVRKGFDTVGDLIDRYRFKQALSETLALAQEVNAYVSQSEPWKVAKTDPDAARVILGTAYDAICDLNVMFSVFLPHGAQRVWDNLGVDITVPLPTQTEVGDEDDRHLILSTSGTWQPWESLRVAPDTELGPASQLFAKIDPDVIEEELARLAA